MVMAFEELDATTRSHMLRRFEGEETAGAPYRSNQLSAAGLVAYASVAGSAIATEGHNEENLAAALCDPAFWLSHYIRQGKTGPVRVAITPEKSATRLALTEFNTWYVAGLADRLLEEGETHCQVYRAEEPSGDRAGCTEYEGQIFPVDLVVAGHRARYWPPPGDADAFTIPNAFNCHHTIRRVRH